MKAFGKGAICGFLFFWVGVFFTFYGWPDFASWQGGDRAFFFAFSIFFTLGGGAVAGVIEVERRM